MTSADRDLGDVLSDLEDATNLMLVAVHGAEDLNRHYCEGAFRWLGRTLHGLVVEAQEKGLG